MQLVDHAWPPGFRFYSCRTDRARDLSLRKKEGHSCDPPLVRSLGEQGAPTHLQPLTAPDIAPCTGTAVTLLRSALDS